jgi:hypothetical protein
MHPCEHVGQRARRISFAKLATDVAQSGVEQRQLAVVHARKEMVEEVVPKCRQYQGQVRLLNISAQDKAFP